MFWSPSANHMYMYKYCPRRWVIFVFFQKKKYNSLIKNRCLIATKKFHTIWCQRCLNRSVRSNTHYCCLWDFNVWRIFLLKRLILVDFELAMDWNWSFRLCCCGGYQFMISIPNSPLLSKSVYHCPVSVPRGAVCINHLLESVMNITGASAL